MQAAVQVLPTLPARLSRKARRRDCASGVLSATGLTGFGLADCKLLSQTRHTDWLRDAVLAYDLLKSLAEEVSIVGHSTRASLAALALSS